MRCNSAVVCILVAMLFVGFAGCHSTGVWNSDSWQTSSFNPATWRPGIKHSPSSLAVAPPAKPSLAATPTYPNTADASNLASTAAPPNVDYPTTAASFNSPGAGENNSVMAPQQGRYGAADTLATNPLGGFNNPVYNSPANNPDLVQSPYRATAPAVPESNGSLAGGSPYNSSQAAPAYSIAPYSNQTGASYDNSANEYVNSASRYQATVASSSGSASATAYSNDPNSRYYSGATSGAAANDSPSATPPYDSAALPKVVGGYPSTSTGAAVIATAKAPEAKNGYPTASPPVNVSAPANSALPGANYPITSPASSAPPAASYQPGASGYQPGENQYIPGNTGYTPGDNGYQVPATRSTAPVQSGQSYDNNYGYYGPMSNSPQMAPLDPSSEGAAQPFRPGSTGSVDDYPWSPEYYDYESTSSATAYPNTPSATPVKTSINTSNVMPVGFDQETQTLRR